MSWFEDPRLVGIPYATVVLRFRDSEDDLARILEMLQYAAVQPQFEVALRLALRDLANPDLTYEERRARMEWLDTIGDLRKEEPVVACEVPLPEGDYPADAVGLVAFPQSLLEHRLGIIFD